ncbi:MAG: hypothetical protein PW786_03875 [Arachidicoccus sp.]|nr:hypothetical protein [Arachidicoccus sp.]
MKKNKYILILKICIIALLAETISSCKKPTDGIGLSITTGDVIKYSVMVKIKDAANSGTVPPKLNVSVTGQDADYIYDFSGHKNFTVYNGQIQFIIDPARTPSSGTVDFYVQVSAPGYLPALQEVTVTPSRLTQEVDIKLTNINTPPAGTKIASASFKLSGGALPSTSILKLQQNTSSSTTKSTGNESNKTTIQSIKQNTYAVNTNDTTYYDDGLTSVVLPKGTTFYYYKWRQTGTVSVVDTVKNSKIEIDSSASANGTTKVYVRLVTYYNYYSYNYPVGVWDTIKYTGDTIQVFTTYNTSNTDINYSAYQYYGEVPDVPGISLLSGGTYPEDELLYKSAVSKRLSNISFYGKLNGSLIVISPSSSYRWFTSFAINTNFVNPITNKKIQAGDSLEIGIDPVTYHTIRQVVKAAHGQLRAQIQSTDMGIYYHAPYITAYNYTFTSALTAVPDLENASCYLNLGVLSVSIPGSNFGSYVYNGKICSASPITTSTPKVNYYYWNQPAGTIAYSNSMNVFSGFQAPGNPVSKFNITIFPQNSNSGKPIGYQPSGYVYCYAYAHSTSYYGVAYIENGTWETKIYDGSGLPRIQGYVVWNGKVHSFDTQTLGSSLSYTQVANEGNTYNLEIYVGSGN